MNTKRDEKTATTDAPPNPGSAYRVTIELTGAHSHALASLLNRTAARCDRIVGRAGCDPFALVAALSEFVADASGDGQPGKISVTVADGLTAAEPFDK